MKGERFRAGKRLWSKADDRALRRIYPHIPSSLIARQLRRSLSSIYLRAAKFGLHKSAAYLASPDAYRLRRGDHPGKATQFKPGSVPFNKGLRRPGWAPGRMRETQFKPGIPSWRTMPIGGTRFVGGYIYRKVSDTPRVPWTRNWEPDHVLLWERTHGPVPAGHALIFRNRDRTDIRLDNLELLTRRDLMARNSVHNLPKPLADAVQLLGALNRQVRRRTRDGAQDRRSA